MGDPLYIVPDPAKADPESPDHDPQYVAELNESWPYVDADTGQRFKGPGISTGFPESPHEPTPLVHVSELEDAAESPVTDPTVPGEGEQPPPKETPAEPASPPSGSSESS